jgi:hypothetical protein
MWFQKVNRSDAEKVFISVYNSYATAAVTVGQVVAFDYTTDADGVGVTRPTTALLPLVAGVVAQPSIAAGDYGLIQVYGHNTDALVEGATDVAVGDQLAAQNASFSLVKCAVTGISAANDYVATFFVAGQAYTTTAAAAKKVFIRCL